MNHFEKFLNERCDSDSLISTNEVQKFTSNLKAPNKLQFLRNLRVRIKKILKNDFPSHDAKDFTTLHYKKVLEYITQETENIEDDLSVAVSDESDVNNLGMLLSRDEFTILVHYQRKYKVISEKLSNRKLGDLSSELTNYSAHNIRHNLSRKELEGILATVDKDKIVDFLEAVIDDMRNDRL